MLSSVLTRRRGGGEEGEEERDDHRRRSACFDVHSLRPLDKRGKKRTTSFKKWPANRMREKEGKGKGEGKGEEDRVTVAWEAEDADEAKARFLLGARGKGPCTGNEGKRKKKRERSHATSTYRATGVGRHQSLRGDGKRRKGEEGVTLLDESGVVPAVTVEEERGKGEGGRGKGRTEAQIILFGSFLNSLLTASAFEKKMIFLSTQPAVTANQRQGRKKGKKRRRKGRGKRYAGAAPALSRLWFSPILAGEKGARGPRGFHCYSATRWAAFRGPAREGGRKKGEEKGKRGGGRK